MEIFDARNKEWTLESGYINEKRLENYKKIKSSLADKCSINIDKRIGMESTMAEVYQISVNEFKVAAKILPIINDSSFDNNQKEIDMAVKASNLVLNKQSIYFPIVYDYTFCYETYFYGSKNFKLHFYEKSLRYQQFKVLINDVKDEKVLNKIIKYKKNFIEPEVIKNILKLNIDLPINVTSRILFSEVACFDLDYHLDTNILTQKKLYDLLNHIFKAIEDMQVKLHILHNDLHLGNILIIKSGNYSMPLIHDFGKSRYFNYKNETYDKEHDLLFFIGKFEEKIKEKYFEDLNRISKILRGLSEVIDVLYESKENFPIVDVVKYWNSIQNLF